MVVAAETRASEAGLSILLDGGTAIEAAIATAGVLGVKGVNLGFKPFRAAPASYEPPSRRDLYFAGLVCNDMAQLILAEQRVSYIR